MRKHRGLTNTTLDVYDGILAGLLDALGDDVRNDSAEALRTFVLDRARPHGIYRAKRIVVDWRNGTITLCGKGRRQESLPLPQEVGNAILLYLNQGRPSLRAPEIFTSVLPPIRTLTRAGVTHIVRSAFQTIRLR
jgi:integrase